MYRNQHKKWSKIKKKKYDPNNNQDKTSENNDNKTKINYLPQKKFGNQHKQIHKQMLERMWKKGNPSALLVGLQTGEATVENSMEFPQKTKNGTAFWPRNSTAGIIP